MTTSDVSVGTRLRLRSGRRLAAVLAVLVLLGTLPASARDVNERCEDDPLPRAELQASAPTLVCGYVVAEAQPVMFMVLWDRLVFARIEVLVSTSEHVDLAVACDLRVTGGPCEVTSGDPTVGRVAGSDGSAGRSFCIPVTAGARVQVHTSTVAAHEDLYLRQGRAIVYARAWLSGCYPDIPED